jgi:hypothetical protein
MRMLGALVDLAHWRDDRADICGPSSFGRLRPFYVTRLVDPGMRWGARDGWMGLVGVGSAATLFSVGAWLVAFGGAATLLLIQSLLGNRYGTDSTVLVGASPPKRTGALTRDHSREIDPGAALRAAPDARRRPTGRDWGLMPIVSRG